MHASGASKNVVRAYARFSRGRNVSTVGVLKMYRGALTATGSSTDSKPLKRFYEEVSSIRETDCAATDKSGGEIKEFFPIKNFRNLIAQIDVLKSTGRTYKSILAKFAYFRNWRRVSTHFQNGTLRVRVSLATGSPVCKGDLKSIKYNEKIKIIRRSEACSVSKIRFYDSDLLLPNFE